jgi:hypothetical protein
MPKVGRPSGVRADGTGIKSSLSYVLLCAVVPDDMSPGSPSCANLRVACRLVPHRVGKHVCNSL